MPDDVEKQSCFLGALTKAQLCRAMEEGHQRYQGHKEPKG